MEPTLISCARMQTLIPPRQPIAPLSIPFYSSLPLSSASALLSHIFSLCPFPLRASLLSVALRLTSPWLVCQSTFVPSAQDTRGRESFTILLLMAKRWIPVMKQNSSTLKASKNQSDNAVTVYLHMPPAKILFSSQTSFF